MSNLLCTNPDPLSGRRMFTLFQGCAWNAFLPVSIPQATNGTAIPDESCRSRKYWRQCKEDCVSLLN